jgi:adenylyltransferase/sulfurtransferase
MPILKVPTPLCSYTAGKAEIRVQAATAGAAMRDLVRQYPALQVHLYNSRGELRSFVNLFLGEVNVRDLQGLETPLNDGDTLRLVPAVAGG